MEENEDPTLVECQKGKDGQILAGIDDLLVLLKRRARDWFGDKTDFLEDFDHVVEETCYRVKSQIEKTENPDTDTMVDEGDPNAD